MNEKHARIYDLVNESTGETYKLNELNGYLSDLLGNVSGIGYTYNPTYQKVGNDFVLTENELKQEPISGEVRFLGDRPYEKYQRFLKFIQGKELALMYRPSSVYYKKYGRVLVVAKSEPGASGLKCSIKFYPRTQWLEEFSVSGTDMVVIESDTALHSKCHIAITGEITTPVWVHTVNGVQETTGAISGSIASGETLHIRTDNVPYRLYKTNAQGVETNIYAQSDFSTERFVTIEPGTNVISCLGATGITITGYFEHEAV